MSFLIVLALALSVLVSGLFFTISSARWFAHGPPQDFSVHPKPTKKATPARAAFNSYRHQYVVSLTRTLATSHQQSDQTAIPAFWHSLRARHSPKACFPAGTTGKSWKG